MEREQDKSKTLGDAENRVQNEKGHCYCPSCLHVVADKANEVLWEAICDNDISDREREKMYWDFEYIVLPNGLKSKLVHGQDLQIMDEKVED